MNKKRLYSLLAAVAIVSMVFILAFVLNNRLAFEGKIPPDSRTYAKINALVDEHIHANGVYLLNTEEKHVVYLVLDGSHLSFSNEIPRYSEITIDQTNDKLTIHLREDWKTFSTKEDSELRLIYRILVDENIEYVDVYKNGERSAFDAAILSGS